MQPTDPSAPRLDLRVPVASDAPVFARIFDAEVMRHIGTGAVRDAEDYARFVARQAQEQAARGHCLWTLVVDGVPAGFVGAHEWTADWGPTGAVEIGWRLGREFWGRGLATTAARRVLEQLARQGHRDVVAVVHAENAASRRLAERLGMHHARSHQVAGAQLGDAGHPGLTAYEYRIRL